MVDRQGGGGEYDFAPLEPGPKRQGEIPLEKPVEKRGKKERKESAKQETLLEERLCPHCGFKIVGKALRGRCPECAAMLDETATTPLQFSDGKWLTTMSNGTLLLAVAVMAQGAAVALGWQNAGLEAKTLTLATWMGAVGVWLLTWPETEGGGGQAAKLPLRSGSRWAAVTVALLWTVAMIHESSIEGGGRDGVAILALLATAAEGVLVALHLRMLAMRIPNESLGTQFLNLAFFVPGISLVLAVVQLTGQTNVWALKEWVFCGFSIEGLMGIVMLWAAATLLWMAMELRNCVVAGQNIETRKRLKMQQQEKERQEREQRR
ncbi:MAG: hypothetical protein FWD61_04260 [Phycisphaerales bacterium]|nr:hypothetical protein [Phycisphaerales bacterium]